MVEMKNERIFPLYCKNGSHFWVHLITPARYLTSLVDHCLVLHEIDCADLLLDNFFRQKPRQKSAGKFLGDEAKRSTTTSTALLVLLGTT